MKKKVLVLSGRKVLQWKQKMSGALLQKPK